MGRVNWGWLERRMEQLGITYDAIKREFHFSPDTIKAWDAGGRARPFSLRKLANILQVSYVDLVRGLGVRPMTGQQRRARAKASR